MRSTDTNGLAKGHFVKVPQTKKWYDVYSDKKDFSQSKVNYWYNEPAQLSAFNRIAQPNLATRALASRPVPVPTL